MEVGDQGTAGSPDTKAGGCGQEAGTHGKETKAVTDSQGMVAVADSQGVVAEAGLPASQLEGGWDCEMCGGVLKSQTQVQFLCLVLCTSRDR